MRAFLLFFIVIAALASYPFFTGDESDVPQAVTGLPWQIDILDDGSTRVFDLRIGHDTLADALDRLGDDMELAVVAATDEPGSLEMYYGHYRAGLLSGKLVLRTDATPAAIKRWRANAINTDYMASGKAKKFMLSDEDRQHALKETISSLTFVPAVNLDEDIIIARFGKPDQRIVKPGAIHFLYATKGLDIALHENSKEVLQYVEPDAFEQLSSPLQ